MLLQPYQADELHFAYCYHAYLRWQTHRARPYPPLAALNPSLMQTLLERFAIRILDCASDPTEVRVLVSLRPEETIAACASKLKGQTSKWLRQAMGSNQLVNTLSKGYFACTTGKSERDKVEQYLERQGEHHGYAERRLSPVHVVRYTPSAELENRLQAAHAFTRLDFHLVLATWKRRGAFGPDEAKAVAAQWEGLQAEQRFGLLKLSFLPDHVHLALRLHPSVAPANLVRILMNAAQTALWEHFAGAMIQARLERLWQPSAYVGTFGDLATPKMEQYIRNWRASQERN
jgi:REP element-mobilizing transposase RayT